MEATPLDAALYFNDQMVNIWRERKLGSAPAFLCSENDDGTVNFSVNGRALSTLYTVDHSLVANGVDNSKIDLQDGDQFYQLIDRIISDVL